MNNVSPVMRRGRKYYRARLVFEADPFTGIRPTPKDFIAATAREAHAKREAYKKQNHGPQSADTFGAFLRERFFPFEEARAQSGALSWARFKARKSRLQRFILEDELGRVLRVLPLGRLTPARMDAFFSDPRLVATISAGVQLELRMDLSLAIRMARHSLPVHWTQYFSDIKPPTVTHAERPVFDAELILKSIHNEAHDLYARLIVATLFITLCRPSEMFALQWDDIDWSAGLVRFDKAVREGQSGHVITPHGKGGPKGDRAVPIGATLGKLLKGLQRLRMARNEASRFIFLDDKGRPFHRDTFKKAWPGIKTALGLPDGYSFYSLKHSGNSYRAQQGVSPEVRAKQMGHTTARMATKDYRRFNTAEFEQATALFDKVPRKRAG